MASSSSVDSLLEICLRVVVDNAASFANDQSADPSFRYVTSPFSNIERHLVSTLLTRLASKKNLAPNVIGPLLRPDLDDITIPASAAPTVGGPFLALLGARCRRIRKLYLPQCKGISNQALTQFSTIQVVSQLEPNMLKDLDLSSCTKLGDSAILECIQRHSGSLKKFRLPYVPVASSTLTKLGQCAALEFLDLTGSQSLDDASLSAITQGCSALQTLIINDCWHATESSITTISRLPALQTLEASLLSVDDTSLRQIVQSCSQLTSLNLASCSRLSSNAVFLISRYVGSRLKSLRLDGSKGCRNFFDLRSCSNLEFLSLAGCEVLTQDLCDAFSEMSCLKDLYLSSTPSDLKNPVMVSLLPSASTLTVLDLADAQSIDDVGLESIIHLAHNIEVLNLSNCPKVTNSLIFKLAALAPVRLRSLNVQGNKNIKADAIVALFETVTSLESINLSRCEHITKKDCETLAKIGPKVSIIWQ